MSWMHRLPNVKLGLTSNLLRFSGAADVLCAIPMSNVLLESDAPYLPPPSLVNINTPWALLPVARRIAELKGITVSDVLAQTLHNNNNNKILHNNNSFLKKFNSKWLNIKCLYLSLAQFDISICKICTFFIFLKHGSDNIYISNLSIWLVHRLYKS